MLKIQACIDLRGADAAVAQQLLHGPQIAARLQHMAGKRVAQHVRMHRLRQPRLLAALAHAVPHLGRTDAPPAHAHEQGRLLPLRPKGLRPQRQPLPQGCQCGRAHRHAAALAAFAQHMHQGGGFIHPAQGLGTGLGIQPDQFTHAQAAAVEQLGQRCGARFLPGGAGSFACEGRQLHRRIHRQGLGQALRGLGRANALHRVALHPVLPRQPVKKPPPARQAQSDAGAAAPLAVPLGHAAADVLRLQGTQRHGKRLPQGQ